jgi:hypothetical protein
MSAFLGQRNIGAVQLAVFVTDSYTSVEVCNAQVAGPVELTTVN